MHCDDKRTKFALQEYVRDATLELTDLEKQLKEEMVTEKKEEIQNRIKHLEKAIQESKDQLSTMN